MVGENDQGGVELGKVYIQNTFIKNLKKVSEKNCVSCRVGTPTEVCVGLENCFLIRLWSLTCLELVTVTQQYILQFYLGEKTLAPTTPLMLLSSLY